MSMAEMLASLAVMTYLVVVALLLGSFINLAADRLPRHESLMHPRSHCRSCGRVLNPVDLIPVGGYLIRGGRCAGCGVSIGASSPAVEALCGALMLAPLAWLGLVPGALLGGGAVAVLGFVVVGLSLARNRAARLGSRLG
jgi:prepilin signal peptidase PulO-like enzyme (type II secretory pathway)